MRVKGYYDRDIMHRKAHFQEEPWRPQLAALNNLFYEVIAKVEIKLNLQLPVHEVRECPEPDFNINPRVKIIHNK